MASSVVLTLKCGRSQADMIEKLVTHSGSRGNAARTIVNFIEGLGAGVETAALDIQTAAAAPAAASGTMTLTFGSMANNDTVTVAGVVLTAVTGAPAGPQFQILTDAPTTAANLVALINSNATTKQYVSAANVAGVVTITALQKGVLGNLVSLASSNGTGVAVSGATLAGGTGGAMSALTSFTFGL